MEEPARSWTGTAPGGAVQQASVPTGWLAEFDRDPEAAAVARRLADRSLLLTLQLEEFSGPTWERVRTELAKYGLSVMTAWVATGKVWAKRAEKGFRPRMQPPRSISVRRALTEEAQDIAAMLVATSLNSFRSQVLLQHRWQPEKGASLTTYFIGWCLLQFNTIYRSWQAERRRSEPTRMGHPLDNDRAWAEDPGADPARQLVQETEVESLIERAAASSRQARVRSVTQQILQRVAEGDTHVEIAAEMGMTEAAVGEHLRRLRNRMGRQP